MVRRVLREINKYDPDHDTGFWSRSGRYVTMFSGSLFAAFMFSVSASFS